MCSTTAHGAAGGRAGAGGVEDLVDDLALLQASVGFDAERLGHFQEGVLVLRFENRLFECRSGHGCSSLLAAMWSDQASDGVSGEGGRPMSPEDRSPEQNSHTTENSGCGSDDRATCTLSTLDRSMQRQRPTSCSMSRSTASRSLATSWVTSGQLEQVGEVVGQRRSASGRRLDRVGELRRVGGGERTPSAPPIASANCRAAATPVAVCGSSTIAAAACVRRISAVVAASSNDGRAERALDVLAPADRPRRRGDRSRGTGRAVRRSCHRRGRSSRTAAARSSTTPGCPSTGSASGRRHASSCRRRRRTG